LKTEHWRVRIVVVSSLLRFLSRNSIVKKALKMTQRDVKIAVRQENVREEETVRCSTLYGLNVVRRLRFLSNLQVKDLFTAVIALEPDVTVTKQNDYKSTVYLCTRCFLILHRVNYPLSRWFKKALAIPNSNPNI